LLIKLLTILLAHELGAILFAAAANISLQLILFYSLPLFDRHVGRVHF